MSGIFARKALLQKGWADDVRLQVEAGRLTDVTSGTTAEAADVQVGIALPGLANGHSHAFQRALVGRTEERSPAGRDSFWTWRERMYALAEQVDAKTLEAIARQAYTEMLESGYTAVVEFHYLHHPTSGESAADMFAAIASAASASGIRLTYVPVFYERAGFDAPDLASRQKLFALDIDSFLAHRADASGQSTATLRVGIGAHSLRAVSAASLQEIVSAAGNDPLHLHIAEQQGEVEQCVAATGKRPVEWLLDHHDIDESWCLVHATHMNSDETRQVATSGATVCLCPSTEANLGDGLFPLHDYLAAGGRIAIGSDSHVTINPFEELRWLEYGQRLAANTRNIAALDNKHVGYELYTDALEGGAAAAGESPIGLQTGAAADLVTLDDSDPMLAGHTDATLLDALVFSGYRLPIDRVMVHGNWWVTDGKHLAREAARSDYAAAVQNLGDV